jgi:hypothetical protein
MIRLRSFFGSHGPELAVFSLSVANLCFLPVWAPLLSLAENPTLRFFQQGPPHLSILWALLADIVGLAVIIFISAVLRKGRSLLFKRLGTAVLFACAGLALYQIGRWFSKPLNQASSHASLLFKLALSGIFLFSLTRFPRQTKAGIKRLLLILAPMLLILALQGFWSYTTVDLRRAGVGQASAPLLPVAEGAPRVIWVVFDEMDERLLSDARPKRIQMPEFDRLRAESLFADRVTPPGPETLWSMPSFLLGRKIHNPEGDTSRLSVQFTDGSRQDFASQPNVFRKARADGFNTGLTGWYLPYCRLIGQDLNDCTWASLGSPLVCTENLLRLQPFYGKAFYLIRWTARLTIPRLLAPDVTDMAPDDALARRYQTINAVKVTTDNGIRMLRNPKLNFVLIHVPAPHPPGIWDIHKQEFALSHTDYLDNYELADRILGQIRRTLESVGDWDRAALLVTSDHPYRTAMWISERIWNAEMTAVTGSRPYSYVPFFLKLPFQRSPLAYRREFSNVLSGNLLLDILEGRLRTPSEATAWIDQH